MTVFVLDAASETVRGELTRWFLEVKPNVFVGRVNVKIRDLLWERICQGKVERGAVMIYDAPGEQGFEMKLHGTPRRTVVDFDGIQLIRVENEPDENDPLTAKRPGGGSWPGISAYKKTCWNSALN